MSAVPKVLAADRASAGWVASLELGYEQRRGSTALIKRKHFGPLNVQRPFYPEAGGVCHTYLLHPPAGIVGGDELILSSNHGCGTHALLTTPGATRFYASNEKPATLRQEFRIEAEATLEWLPQETLIFDGATANMSTRIRLDAEARFCGWEIVGLGRPASGELFREGALDLRFEIFRAGELQFRERLCSAGAPHGLGDGNALATMIVSACDSQAIDIARGCCQKAAPLLCAPTLIKDMLIVRGIAADCTPLANLCRKIWSALRPGLYGRNAEPPRIWRT